MVRRISGPSSFRGELGLVARLKTRCHAQRGTAIWDRPNAPVASSATLPTTGSGSFSPATAATTLNGHRTPSPSQLSRVGTFLTSSRRRRPHSPPGKFGRTREGGAACRHQASSGRAQRVRLSESTGGAPPSATVSQASAGSRAAGSCGARRRRSTAPRPHRTARPGRCAGRR